MQMGSDWGNRCVSDHFPDVYVVDEIWGIETIRETIDAMLEAKQRSTGAHFGYSAKRSTERRAPSDLSANIGTGTVVVHGDDSRWNFRQGEFGTDGLGSVAVEAGGRIAATEDITVGLNSTSQGSLHVTGNGTLADSLVSVGGDLVIGELGQGTLTVDLGGDVTVGNDLLVGGDPNNLSEAPPTCFMLETSESSSHS